MVWFVSINSCEIAISASFICQAKARKWSKSYLSKRRSARHVSYFSMKSTGVPPPWLFNPVSCEINLRSHHSIGGSREKNEDSSTKKVLTELLVQISSIHPKEQVTIVGATNRLWVVLCQPRMHCASSCCLQLLPPAVASSCPQRFPPPFQEPCYIFRHTSRFKAFIYRCDLDTALLRRFERRIEGAQGHKNARNLSAANTWAQCSFRTNWHECHFLICSWQRPRWMAMLIPKF